MEKRRLGTKRITPVKLIDLTVGSNDVAVVLKMSRNTTNSNVLDQIAQEKRDSPWSEDALAKNYLAKDAKSEKLKDPIATLKRVNTLLGRG